MKKQIFKIALIAVMAIFSSCAMHTGEMLSSASLSTSNFSYIKNDVLGTAKATYIFGIGGLSKRALVNNAKKQLLESNPLKNNQTLANITINWRTTFFLLGFSKRCTITADIVEFK